MSEVGSTRSSNKDALRYSYTYEEFMQEFWGNDLGYP